MIQRGKRIVSLICGLLMLFCCQGVQATDIGESLELVVTDVEATTAENAQDAEASQEAIQTPTPITAEELAEAETKIETGTLPDEIRLLLETAIAEIGYTEEESGYSKYGAWAGDAYSEWCAEFVCWCVNMTDVSYGYDLLDTVYPFYTGQNTGKEWYIKRGKFVFRKGYSPGWGWQWLKEGDDIMETNEYIPNPGDLMYFSYNSEGDTVHVALVEYCAYTADGDVNVHVIEGNNPDSVQRNVYALDNSQVLGYGCWDDVVDTTIQFGNTGDKVLALQEDLGQLGYLAQRHFTGTYASNTRNAITAFQKTMDGKTPTGIADRDTQQAIANALKVIRFNDLDSWLVTDAE